MNYLTLFGIETFFNKLLPLLDLRAELDLRSKKHFLSFFHISCLSKRFYFKEKLNKQGWLRHVLRLWQDVGIHFIS